jgi:hypothetical protein
MNLRRTISIITLIIFGFVFCMLSTIKITNAQTRGDDLETCIGENCPDDEVETMGQEGETGSEEGDRTASWYQRDTITSGWGATIDVGAYGADYGYGETGYTYSYTDPLTGQYVSYQTSGMGMGTIPAPVYGGMYSALGAQSYGPYSGGQQPTVQPTYGWDTQSSVSGSALGQSSQYTSGSPNYTAMLGTSLLSSPYTAGAGYGLAAASGALSGFGSLGGLSTLGSYGTGFGSLGGFGSYGLGTSYPAYGGTSFGGGYSVPYCSTYSGYSGLGGTYSGYPVSAGTYSSYPVYYR